MPLLALVDGQRTVATLLSDEDWLALQGATRAKTRQVVMQPCGLPGHLQTSRRGLRYFAHNKGGGECGEHTGESPLHLAAKAEIILGAVDAAWEAEPEHRGDGWVADVLALRDQRRIAFEVQVSQQVASEYFRRQERYAASGVRCAWFAKHLASVPAPSKQLPVFLLIEDEARALNVEISGQNLSLRQAVTHLLSRRIQFRRHLGDGSPGSVTTFVHETDCYRCGAAYLVWDVQGENVRGACGLTETVSLGSGEMWADDRPEALPAVQRAVAAATADLTTPTGVVGRRATRMSGTTYSAFSCPSCRAVFGEFFYRQFLMEVAYDEPLRIVTSPGRSGGMLFGHWCIERGEGFCQDPA